MLFTLISLYTYVAAGGIFIIFVAVIGIFFGVYIGGCIIAAKESTKFLYRFREKVRLNEINGISVEDLEDALGAKRIFWMGNDFEVSGPCCPISP